MATLLAVSGFGLLQIGLYFYPRLLQLGSVPWVAWLLVFTLPEIIFVIGIVKLWKKRKPMAVGILLAAVMLGTHFVMHIVSHFNG
jgi:hypothetical protein